jgi:phosphoribosylformimino-5-aminoimidazole carboxamide ribotide isomerase
LITFLSMIIYPAIDLKDGKCVRLYKGDMNTATTYNDDPAAQAHEFTRLGFSWLHLVDLNGAVEGRPVNVDAVHSIINTVDIPVQLGGGIRTFEQIETWNEAGVSRVILGTVAVKDPDLVRRACAEFPGQIALGIDAVNERVATEGWVEASAIPAIDLARRFEDAGAAAIIYTDIDRDGTGQGLNIESTKKLAEAVSIPVIASGGVGMIEDILTLRMAEASGIEGVIVGRAFYEGTVSPQEAILVSTGEIVVLPEEANDV